MPHAMGSFPNGYSLRGKAEMRASTNTTASVLALRNTINRSAGSKNSREKIAVWSRRLWRLIRCVSGLISKALAGHGYQLQQSKADDLAQPKDAPSSYPEMDTMTDHLFLPEKEELDKLLRCEAMINRQFEPSDRRVGKGAVAQEGRDATAKPIALLRNKAKKVFDFSNRSADLYGTKPNYAHRRQYRNEHRRRPDTVAAGALDAWLYSAEARGEQKRVRELLTQSRELLKQLQVG